jgi:hypothetical protein
MSLMKKITKIMALALVAGSVFTFAACGSSKDLTTTNAYWDTRVVKDDLSESSEWFTKKEVATYSISFEEGTNTSYSVNYVLDGSKTAEYTTEFYAQKFDWNNDAYADYKTDKTESVYVYKTTLALSGTYSVKASGETKDFDDTIESVCYFRSANGNLQPVYSLQIVKNTLPSSLTANTIADAFVELDSVYETFYNYNCTEAYVKTTDNLTNTSTDKKVNVDGNYSLFDRNELNVALRSFTSGSSTYVFDVMIAAEGATQSYQTSYGTSSYLSSETDGTIIDALNSVSPDSYIFTGKNSDGEVKYEYNVATLSLVSSMPGSSITYWYAAVPSNSFNSARATMLKISSPLSFSLGTINYSLKSLSQIDI